MLFISSWFIRFSVAKVPWQQVSSIAKAMIPLLDCLCWTLTGTTHMLRTWPEPIAAYWVLLILAQLLLIISDVLSSLLDELSPLSLTWSNEDQLGVYQHISCRFFELENSEQYVIAVSFHSTHNILLAGLSFTVLSSQSASRENNESLISIVSSQYTLWNLLDLALFCGAFWYFTPFCSTFLSGHQGVLKPSHNIHPLRSKCPIPWLAVTLLHFSKKLWDFLNPLESPNLICVHSFTSFL